MTYEDYDTKGDTSRGRSAKIAAGLGGFTVFLFGMLAATYLGTGCWPVM